MKFTSQIDSALTFPSVTIVNASAGSGKTYNLTFRLLQFLLSDVIPKNGLRNVLAVTFTNNAVREMRDRVIDVMKNIALGDAAALREASALLSMPRERVVAKAGQMVDLILDHYSDFQVRTIDSFLTMIFRECALDYGFQPDAQIALGDYRLIDTAFDIFVREAEREGQGEALLQPLVELVQQNRRNESSYIWDPYRNLSRYVKELHQRFVPEDTPLAWKDHQREIRGCLDTINACIQDIDITLREYGLDPLHRYRTFCELIRSKNFPSLVDRAPLPLPARRPAHALMPRYEEARPILEPIRVTVNTETERIALLLARSFYQPYLRALRILDRTLENVKRREGVIFLDDVHTILARYIGENSIPDVYLRLGETLYHFLIDEFQDTSPVQWATMQPLVENSLAEGGSLFIVGDPKQSIYGFRGADWRIMTGLESPGAFPSAGRHDVAYLGENYRSAEHIVEFTREVFHRRVPEAGYRDAAEVAGLLDYQQTVLEGQRNRGYVEVAIVQGDTEVMPEKAQLNSIIADLLSRGFRYGDIAVVTPANDDVIRVSTWLNESSTPFVSHSSLDIRKRTSVGEMISLLSFLDSPVDNLSFANVVLGVAFERWSSGSGVARAEILHCFLQAGTGAILYTHFRDAFPALWADSFEHLLKVVGYLPLYDLLIDCYTTFHVFEHQPLEEASLARLAEVTREYEGRGTSNIRDFLEFTDDGEETSHWEMDVPTNIDAVTVMTVHKAKGLGFPVTLVLLYDRDDRSTNMFYGDLGDGVEILRITRKMADRVPVLAAVYDQQALRNRVEDLNMMYVALTRAKLELYVLGVKTGESKPPVLFLPGDGYHRGQKGRGAGAIQAAGVPTHRLFHHVLRTATEVSPTDVAALAERKRGDYVHLLLAGIEFIADPLREQVTQVAETLDSRFIDPTLGESATGAVIGFLSDNRVLEFFRAAEGRTVQREQRYADGNGHVYRMDRVIIDGGQVTVMDFKTGGMDAVEAHEQQVQGYVRLLREIFTERQVNGVIAYVDRRVLREVR